VALSFVNLNLNDFTLTLGSLTSDLTVINAITIDASTEGISTGEADLTVEGDFTLAQGKLKSTSGKLIFRQGGTQSGSSEFDLGASILYLGADYTKSGGNLLSSSATLDLLVDLAITSDSALSFNQLNLNNLTLTLGSESSDLQVSSALILDNSNERVMTGPADLSLLAFQDMSIGGLISTGGTINFSGGGRLSGTGELDLRGSTWGLGGDFVKSSGTLTISEGDNVSVTDLALSGNSKLTSDVALSFVTLNLNNFKLTLGSSTSDLTVENAITINASTEGILTGGADLILMSALTLSAGDVTSTGGIVSLSGGGQLSGTGKLDVSGSTLTLGGVFVKSNGTLTISETTDLALSGSSTLTSDVALNFKSLNLNEFTLTLGSSTSDLTVTNAITIEASTEGILTGAADLSLLAFQDISIGGVTSTGGTINFSGGGQLSGAGILDVSGSTWTLGGVFEKSNGTLTISQTNLALSGNSTLTSDEALSFVTLNLNDFKLTLGSSDSDLTVQNAITLDTSTEGISTGGAALIVMRSLNMSAGLLGSTGGTWVLSKDFLKSGGTLTISQTNLELKDSIKLTSDVALSFVTLKLNSKTLTLGSATSDLTVKSPLNDTGFISSTTEGISTGGADLILKSHLIIDGEGSVTSTSGEVSFLAGGRLSGSGE